MNPRLKETLTFAGIFFVLYLAASFVIEVIVRHQSFSLGQTLIKIILLTILYAALFYFLRPLNKKRTDK